MTESTTPEVFGGGEFKTVVQDDAVYVSIHDLAYHLDLVSKSMSVMGLLVQSDYADGQAQAARLISEELFKLEFWVKEQNVSA